MGDDAGWEKNFADDYAKVRAEMEASDEAEKEEARKKQNLYLSCAGVAVLLVLAIYAYQRHCDQLQEQEDELLFGERRLRMRQKEAEKRQQELAERLRKGKSE